MSIGILANDGYIYKILTAEGTLLTSGVLDMRGFVGPDGADAYETWLAAGNTGTIDDFFADIGGLVVNDVRATYNIDKVGAEFVNFYTGDALTQTQVLVQGVLKYTVTYSNLPDGNLEYKLTTRVDAEWFKDSYEYDAQGVVSRVIPTEGV